VRRAALAAASGLVFLVAALNATNWVRGAFTLEVVPYQLLEAPPDAQLLFGAMYPGVFLLGAAPVYAYDRWGLISPAVVVFVPFGAALWFEAAGDPGQADLISPLGVYLVGWVAVFALALLAGGLERAVRRPRAGVGSTIGEG
jgi:hypothetical protein